MKKQKGNFSKAPKKQKPRKNYFPHDNSTIGKRVVAEFAGILL